jgi:hypothetical protein
MATYILTAAQLNNRILNSFSIPSSGGSVDPDAQAFITAATITDPTQQSAINTLVVSLKANNLWTKMRAIYPFVGGTATTHKWNLKDPRDLNAAFRLVFNGGWTHSSSGVQGNGVNNWMNTFFNPATQFSTNLSSAHFSIYSRTIIPLFSSRNDLYVAGDISGNPYLYAYEFNTSINLEGYIFNSIGAIGNNLAPGNTQGLFTISRINNSSSSIYKNQSNLYTDTAPELDTFTSDLIVIGGSDLLSAYSSNQYAFTTIGTGLTNTDTSNLYTAVQAFQTTLGRQV